MFIAYVIVAALLSVVLSASAVFTFTRNEQIVANMQKVGVPEAWYPRLAAVKALGAPAVLGLLAVAAAVLRLLSA